MRRATLIACAALAAGCTKASPNPAAAPPDATAPPQTRPALPAADRTHLIDRTGHTGAAPQPADVTQPRSPPAPPTPLAVAASSSPRYPATRTLSPLTEAVAANIRRIAARGIGLRGDIFMKVGASGSASPWLLTCLAGRDVVLGDFQDLAPTLHALRDADAAGTSPLARRSLAAKPGRTARWAITGDPTPVAEEIAAIQPRFALVHYGTNDMHMAGTFPGALGPFARNLLSLVDHLSDRGVVPSVGALAPRLDRQDADHWVPTYNQVVRAIAQRRRLPLLDMHTAYLSLPNRGRAEDLLHANVLRDAGRVRPCVFTDRGLRFAYNVRNYLSLRLLDQLRAILHGRRFDSEPGAPALVGEGSGQSPFKVDELPFADMRDMRRSRHLDLDGYRCDGAGANSHRTGPEVVYQLDLSRSRRLRVVAVNFKGTQVDLYVLNAQERCVKRAGQRVEGRFPPGQTRIAVETRLSKGEPQWGEFALVISECAESDPACDVPAY